MDFSKNWRTCRTRRTILIFFKEKVLSKTIQNKCKVLSPILTTLLRLHVSTKVTFLRFVVAVRALFHFVWLLVWHFFAVSFMRGQFVGSYALLSTVFTDMVF